MHIAVLSVTAQHAHQLFDLIEKSLNLSLLRISEVFMLVLLLFEHLEVLFTSGDQVLLDVKIEVIQIVLGIVDQGALVPDEVVVVVEDLLAVVVDQVTQLFLAESLVNLDIGDLPVLVKAVEDKDHDNAGRE